jgi:para-aminobenzoate synthetase component 1
MQPWYWRSLPLKGRTGSEVFAALTSLQSVGREPLTAFNFPFATLLESPYPPSPDHPQLSRYSICAVGPRMIEEQPQVWTPPIGQILPCLSHLLQRSPQSLIPTPSSPNVGVIPDPALPFTGGWLGWLGYDFAWEIERLPDLRPDSLPFPVACWYEPDSFAILDHLSQQLWLAATHPNQLDDLETCLANASKLNLSLSSMARDQQILSYQPCFHTSQADYQRAVLRAQQHIQAGDIFQANVSLRFSVQTPTDSWILYRTLQQINPSPFASYWKTPWGAIISCSPERLVSLQGDQVETRPIAGTRVRGEDFAQDQKLVEDLLSNSKERAEHIMLVDLERNDLGRVCTWGSVKVNELLTIERYSHVMHLVSNITGQLDPQKTAIDLIRSLFPGGTITGCPKIRCMEIIEDLEPERRNLFYGSCGYLDWRGNLDLNILIRTLLFQPGQRDPKTQLALNQVCGQIGAGIVADSDPEREWWESMHKAQAQLVALQSVKPWTKS